jgi:hypothetical protein
MENIRTNRINLEISDIPKRYFYIGVLVLLITVLSVFATGYFFQFSDQYTERRMITKKDIQGNIIRIDADSQIFKHLPPQSTIRIYFFNGRSQFLGYGKIDNESKGQFVQIRIDNKVHNVLAQKFKPADTIEVMLQYNSQQKNIFQRILFDQKKRQTTN